MSEVHRYSQDESTSIEVSHHTSSRRYRLEDISHHFQHILDMTTMQISGDRTTALSIHRQDGSGEILDETGSIKIWSLREREHGYHSLSMQSQDHPRYMPIRGQMLRHSYSMSR